MQCVCTKQKRMPKHPFLFCSNCYLKAQFAAPNSGLGAISKELYVCFRTLYKLVIGCFLLYA